MPTTLAHPGGVGAQAASAAWYLGGAALTADPLRWRDVAIVGGFLLLVAATAATTTGLTLVIVGGVRPVAGVAYLLLAATIIVVAILTTAAPASGSRWRLSTGCTVTCPTGRLTLSSSAS